jgi:diguanylate cyclase (GGDEF)-like protein/PAS domain S-box-containing protein
MALTDIHAEADALPTAPGVRRSLAERIDSERVRILYAGAPFSVLIHLLCATLLVVGLHGAVEFEVLAVWYIVMALVCAGRWMLNRGYRDAVKLPGDARDWELRFAVAALVTGLAWSSLVLFAFPAHSIPHQLLVIFVVTVLTVGSAGAVQASGLAFFAFVATTLLAMFVRLLMTGHELYVYAAILIAVSFPATASMFLRLNRSIQESLVTRFEKEDIADDLQRLESQMQQSTLEEKVILETALVGIAFVRGRRILRCNGYMETLFGYGPGELAARSTRVLYRSDQVWNEVGRRIDANLCDAGVHEEELQLYRRDGASVWCRFSGRALDRDNLARGSVWTFVDVSKRHEAERSLARANAILLDAIESIPDAFAVYDREDKLVLRNREYLAGAGEEMQMEQAVGMTFERMVRNSIVRGEPVPPEYSGDAEAWVAERVRRHREPDGNFVLQVIGGRWVQARDRPTAEGGIVSVRTDITELRRNQERAEFLANHDPLTELPNRRLLEDRLGQTLIQARRNQSEVALMVVDLDRFKLINDRYGHRLGDEVLREAAQRLRDCVREVDTVSRVGGDEFVVVLAELRQPQDAALVAGKILLALAQPFDVPGGAGETVRVECSIGIAHYPADGDEPDVLLKAADLTMYRAKEVGRNCYCFASQISGDGSA